MIQECLEKDYYVLLDRYTTSNLAHQGSKIKDKDQRFDMYQWIDKLEYWLLKLPKPDKTIFLHMPYEYSCILKKNREILDQHEMDEEHLKNAERTYIELSELYNWSKIFIFIIFIFFNCNYFINFTILNHFINFGIS